MNHQKIFEQIQSERDRQDSKWGVRFLKECPNELWLTILSEEVGESAKAILERKNLRDELIQVASVAVAWIDCIDRSVTGGSQ